MNFFNVVMNVRRKDQVYCHGFVARELQDIHEQYRPK